MDGSPEEQELERLRTALGQFGREFGVTAFVLDDGTVLAESPMPEAELEPLVGYGDPVSRGDLVRVYYRDSLLRPDERLEFDGVHVNDYGPDGEWFNVLTNDGGITSFSLGGPRQGFSRRLELVEASTN